MGKNHKYTKKFRAYLEGTAEGRADWAGPMAIVRAIKGANVRERCSMVYSLCELIETDDESTTLNPGIVADAISIAANLEITDAESNVAKVKDSKKLMADKNIQDAVTSYEAFIALKKQFSEAVNASSSSE